MLASMRRWHTALALSLAGWLTLTLLCDAAVAARPSKGEKPTAPSTPPLSDVDSAERFYAQLDYEAANKTADRALAQHGLTHDQLVRGYRIFALSSAALGHTEDAREAFIQLLTYNPEFTVDPNLGPRVMDPFLEARGFWRSQRQKPGIEVTIATHVNDVATLRITTRDPTHVVDDVMLGYRWGANSAYTLKPVAIGEAVVVETSIPPSGATRIDYYVQAYDAHDNTVFEFGNPTSPKTSTIEAPPPPVPPPPAEKTSVLKSPFFWTAVVAVLAGGGVGGYFLLKPKEPTSASLSGGATCGDMLCK